MTKLLIFGDSFGEEDMRAYPPEHHLYSAYRNLLSYHSILRSSGLFESVTTYAEGGSDLWSQYKLFEKHYTGSETVLWFETDPLRINGPNGEKYTSVSALEHALFTEKRPEIIKKLEAGLAYFKYLQHDDYCHYVHKKIMDKIRNKCTKIFVLPVFPDCIEFNKYRRCLAEIPNKENKWWGIDRDINRTHYDIRRNHMTETNHRIMAEQLINYYKNGTAFNFNLFVEPTSESPTKYLFKK